MHKAWEQAAKKIVLNQVDAPSSNLIQLFNLTMGKKSRDIRPGCHFTMFPNITDELSPDGYDNLWTPPSPYTNRMWKGGRIEFFHPLKYQQYKMKSILRDVEWKQTNRGSACFTTLQKDIMDGDCVMMREVRTLVYLSQTFTTPKAVKKAATPTAERAVVPDALMLFRFSAATFNSHFIHYNQCYCSKEGYQKPLVHGPLSVSLLLDLCLDHCQRDIKSFEYTCVSPAFMNDPLFLCASKNNDSCYLWSANHQGSLVVKGTASFF
jgi:3-methylfumaryl-CoA hydratase